MSERLLTAKQLGEYLGLSPSTVLDWYQAGELPAFKLRERGERKSGPVRFRQSEVEAWLEERRRGPVVASAGAWGVG